MPEFLSRLWEEIVARPDGPFAFRFYLQPIMASILAVRDGLHDARSGAPPYLRTVIAVTARRRALLRDGPIVRGLTNKVMTTRRRYMLVPRTLLAAAAAIILTSAATAGFAQTPVVRGESTTKTATIEAIDKTDRTVTLKTEDGSSITTRVGDDVTRFDTLKVGDRVTGTYYETVVVMIEQPGQPAFKSGDAEALTKNASAKPGGTVARQVKASGTIEEVTRGAAPAVTVRGDKGRVLSFAVKDPKVLDRLKKGDRIDVTYTEAFLIRVDPPKGR